MKMNNDALFFCDSCEEYKKGDDAEHCKSLRHSIYSGSGKLKTQLKTEYKKLKKSAGTTTDQKEEAREKINKLEKIAGYKITDWSESEPDSSLIKKIYKYLKINVSELVISKDDSTQVYAKVETGDHIEVINLNSKNAINWLMYNHKQSTDEFYNEDVYKNALKHIKADSYFDGSKKESVYNRIAQVIREQGMAIYYDLGTPDWGFVRITKEGYILLSYAKSFPVFERFRGLTEQVGPNELSDRDDPLEELCNLFRIEDKLLFKVHLIHMFFQNQETPFMFFDGESGSIKTTLTEMVKKTVDPTSSNIGSISVDKKELQSNISNKYLTAYDNVSGFDNTISDMLCRALSGDEIAKRALYSDNDLFVKSYSKKKFVFNGISPSITFADFNERTIYYGTLHIPEDEKISKSDLWEKHDELLPHVLHQIFKTISKTLASYGGVGHTVKPKSRLGDFEKYGETISQVLGYKEHEFLSAYYQRRSLISVKDNDTWPIIRVIDTFMQKPENNQSFKGLTSELYTNLTDMAASHFSLDIKDKYSNWPKKAHFLTKQINKLKEQFRVSGYNIDISTYTLAEPKEWHNRSVTTITPIYKKEHQESARQDRQTDKTENQVQNNNNSSHADEYDQHDTESYKKTDNSKHESDDLSGCLPCRASLDGSLENTDNIQYTHWSCKCLSDNPAIFEMGKPDYNENSMKGHQRKGHTIKKFTKSEADDLK